MQSNTSTQREHAVPTSAPAPYQPPINLGWRSNAGLGWNLWRTLIGVAYLAAAAFNTVYTLPRSDALDGYADGAWFGFLQDFMRDVFMPNGDVFMILVIVFEVIVGVLILSRDRAVDRGVIASVLWVIAVLPFLAWPYLLTNIALAVLQGVVLLRHYDRSLVDLLMGRPGRAASQGR